MRSQNEGVPHEDSLTTRLTVEIFQPPEPVSAHSAAMPWWLAALGAGLVCAIAGWALVAALVLVSQLAQTGIVLGSALRLSTQMWLLGQGGILEVAGTRITLVPLGFTAILALILHGTAGYAGRQAALLGGEGLRPGITVLKVTAVVAASYTVVVTLASFLVDAGNLRAASGGMGLSVAMGFLGARKALKWNPARDWPVWARAVPRAVGAGLLTALLGGVVVLLAGLISHRGQIVLMTGQLDPGWTGGIVLALTQLFYVVNIIVWCVSWSFGPGFTLGDGSVVSLMGSQVGLLPAFPLTAALPSGGFSWAELGWLAVPILSGAAAAVAVLRARPRARFDETALVGGLSGVLAGLAVAGLAFATKGSLGTDRLAGLGPFVLPLLVVACSIMGLGGMITGFVAGLVRHPSSSSSGADPRWWSRWGADSDSGDGPSDRSDAGDGSIANGATESVPAPQAETMADGSEAPDPTDRRFGWLTPVMRRARKKADGPADTADAQPTEDLTKGQESTETVTVKAADKAPDEQPALDFHADDR